MSDIVFTPLGYGTLDEVKAKLRPGKYLLVLDEDAAVAGMPSCWFATDDSFFEEEVAGVYEDEGGTASSVVKVEVSGA